MPDSRARTSAKPSSEGTGWGRNRRARRQQRQRVVEISTAMWNVTLAVPRRAVTVLSPEPVAVTRPSDVTVATDGVLDSNVIPSAAKPSLGDPSISSRRTARVSRHWLADGDERQVRERGSAMEATAAGAATVTRAVVESPA